MTIAVETPAQDDVRAMVAALNAYLMPLTPREFQFQLTAEQMAEPTVTVFVARDGGGRAARHGGAQGPRRRPRRGQAHVHAAGSPRTARRLAAARPHRALAQERGITRLVLETGEAPGFEPAWRVYERGGFTVCGAVLDYPEFRLFALLREKPSA